VTAGRALSLAAVLAVAVTGCGGSKSPREQFVSKLNSMCEDFAAREKKIGEPNDPTQLAQRGDQIVTAYDEALVQPLHDLQAPSGIAAEAAQLRAITVKQREALRGLAAAGKAGDVAKVRRLAVVNAQLNAQAAQIALHLKADSCAS
jgi:hypothetical protein